MAGQYANYYRRIGKGKSKRYQCVFESCGNHIVKKLSSIYSHVQRTHEYEIYEIEKEKREEIERERRAEEFAKQQLKEFKKNLPQIKEQNRLEKERQEREKEQRRREEARMIEMWNKRQKEIENERVRRGIFRLLALYEICGITLSNANLNLIMSELLNSFIQE